MEENIKKNLEYIKSEILKGNLYPINLYGYKIECNCKDTYSMIYGDSREKVVNDFKECPICKGQYRISDKIPTDTPTLLIIHQKHKQIPMMMFSNCPPEGVKILEEAGNELLRNNPQLINIIRFKLEKIHNKIKT